MECGNSRSSKGRVSTEQNRTNLKRLLGMKEVVFYYDIVCPYAFMASKLIEGVARRTGAKIQWNRFFWVKYKNTEWWQGRILIYVIGLTAGTSNLRQNHVYYHKSSKKNLEKIIIIIVIMIMIVIIIIIIIILNNNKRNKDPSLRMSVKSLICTGYPDLIIIHDTLHLCTRIRIDGIKAMSLVISWGKQVMKFTNTSWRGRVCSFY